MFIYKSILFHNLIERKGFAAISSVLIISALILIIGLTVSLVSINESQISLASVDSDLALDLTEACAEDALIRINKNNSLPSSITLPQGTCTITQNSGGPSWDFIVSASFSNYTKKVRITATRNTSVDVTSWQEIP